MLGPHDVMGRPNLQQQSTNMPTVKPFIWPLNLPNCRPYYHSVVTACVIVSETVSRPKHTCATKIPPLSSPQIPPLLHSNPFPIQSPITSSPLSLSLSLFHIWSPSLLSPSLPTLLDGLHPIPARTGRGGPLQSPAAGPRPPPYPGPPPTPEAAGPQG